MTLFGIRIRLHILSPLIFLLLSAFSGIDEALSMLLALSVHEAAHLLSAVFLHARIDEIELMPYGAAIRLYSLWETHPVKLFLITLAGPFANLALSAFLSLIIVLFPATQIFLLPIAKNGLLLCVINLIPALPLDGGRCLCALLSIKISRTKAVNIGVILGYAFSFLLIGACLISFLRYGTLSLFPILCSVYIIASGTQEKRQAEGAYLRARLLKSSESRSISRAVFILADQSIPVFEAAKYVHPDERAVYAVTDANGKIISFKTDSEISFSLLENSSREIGNLK